MCEVSSFKNFENSLTTVKVITKTKVAPFYLGHGVDIVYVNNFGLGSRHLPPPHWVDPDKSLRQILQLCV